MRALILVLSALVVALAVSTVVYVDQLPAELRQVGPRFDVHALLADSQAFEYAVYSERSTGQRMRYTVLERPAPLPRGAPRVVLRRDRIGDDGRPLGEAGATVSYDHDLVNHAWFPVMSPEVADQLDRVWIVREIRRDTLRRQGRDVTAWRVDLTDPALPANADAVVAWYDTEIPVFGLLQWQRHDETWVYEHGGIDR